MVLLIGAWTAWRAYVDYTAEYVVVPPSYLSSDVMHARNPPSKVWQVGCFSLPSPTRTPSVQR